MTSASDNLTALVDDMLQDAGLGQDEELRAALVSLGALEALPAPEPTGELAALLAAGGPAQDDQLARRRRRHRPTALGLVLVAGMGLGVGGVAASSTAPGNSAIEHLLEEWAPWGSPTADASYNSAAGNVADGDLTGRASTGAPGGAANPGRPAFRLLQDPAGLSGYTGRPACVGPVMHDAPTGSGKCAAGTGKGSASGAAGGNKDGTGPAAPAGAPVGPPAAGTGNAAAPSAETAAGSVGPDGTARKAAGSAGPADSAPGKAQGAGSEDSAPQGTGSRGAGHGTGQNGASPAK